ncbi:DUF1566 domain-containing protein [Desulfosediminicola ganghwensis]|uniref:Lcl C-terminal domain-containing protein n=1 Tax=Desulfosediminicola ganghwensis TaxID=2569540 RepID=UPI001593014D|nr:DUF1566 domain-containing protein [Desulfosediminicola ganghwensis]
MISSHILSTGLRHCYDENGEVIECHGSGQDAEFLPGINWPAERFEMIDEHLVLDRATDLIWTRNCCISEFPVTWREGLELVRRMNEKEQYSRKDWRMPNRREMRSLIDHSSKNPALTKGHPFQNVFLGWFWTSTTAAIAPRYAWYVHLEGGRMFYGNKDGYSWLWSVSGNTDRLPSTGAKNCYDELGSIIPCDGGGQDGSLVLGAPWPNPRFVQSEFGILDVLTGLIWHTKANLGKQAASWSEALSTISIYARKSNLPWRMPTINELESLVDASTHSPALPGGHPFSDIQQAYWSSTTSSFETDWAYVLYMVKGAVGVGYKKNNDFALWPVMSANKDI